MQISYRSDKLSLTFFQITCIVGGGVSNNFPEKLSAINTPKLRPELSTPKVIKGLKELSAH